MASRPRNASMAAAPVSPEVAPTMVQRRAAPIERAVHQARQDLHGDVLERERRTVKELQQPVVGPDLDQRRDRRMAEAAVGVGQEAAQLLLADLSADERADDAQRHLDVGEPGQIRDLIVRQAGPFGRHVEPAIARKPGQEHILETKLGRTAPGADVSHRRIGLSEFGPGVNRAQPRAGSVQMESHSRSIWNVNPALHSKVRTPSPVNK